MERQMPPVKTDKPQSVRVALSPSEHVTALAYRAARGGGGDAPIVILAHGAGADQTSGFMVHVATELAARGVDTVTFNFSYTEQGRRVPDRNDGLESCWRAVIAAFCGENSFARAGKSREKAGRRRLVIGGKSMGGRIASQVAAAGVDGVAGLVFLGYPLHPPGRPDKLRSEHLGRIRAPMLFVQGSRDSFGTPDELRVALADAKAAADLFVVDGGDHSFKVPKRGALRQDAVYDAVIDEMVRWLRVLNTLQV
jgi:predicted alpha/beta-hydrolase family hydrolase